MCFGAPHSGRHVRCARRQGSRHLDMCQPYAIRDMQKRAPWKLIVVLGHKILNHSSFGLDRARRGGPGVLDRNMFSSSWTRLPRLRPAAHCDRPPRSPTADRVLHGVVDHHMRDWNAYRSATKALMCHRNEHSPVTAGLSGICRAMQARVPYRLVLRPAMHKYALRSRVKKASRLCRERKLSTCRAG